MRKELYIPIIFLFLITFSCNRKEKQYDRYFKGKVKRESIAIAPKVPGRILKINVNESDKVNKGDTLAILDIPEIEAKVKQAKGAFQSARSQYQLALNGASDDERKQIEAMYTAAMEQFSFAEKSYLRLKNMYSDSLIPGQQYDEIYSKYMGAKAQLDAAQAKRQDVLKGTRKERVAMALGDMIRAEGALQEAETACSERYIIAPEKMTIESIALKEGELALPGYNVFVGYLLNSVYFRFTIPEDKVNLFTKGRSYNILMPYQNGIALDAQLVGIKQLSSYANLTSVFPEYDLGESVYEMKLIPVDPSDDILYTNMTVLMERK